jgi:hypothetical protein
MKHIVKFSVLKEISKDVQVIKQDADGKDITVLEKATEKVPYNYILSKPSFSLKQESTLYYESIVAECIKRGIFSTIQLRKRFVDDGGILGSEEKKVYEGLWSKIWVKKSELNKLNEKPEDNKDEIKTLNDEILSILAELQSIEEKSGNSMLYEHTAEKVASDRTAVWWMLFLSYKDNNGKFEPVFGNGKFEDRVKKYEELELSDDSFDYEVIQKLLLASTLWAFGKAEKQEEFDEIFAAGEVNGLIKKSS